jgi:hypothetical protein
MEKILNRLAAFVELRRGFQIDPKAGQRLERRARVNAAFPENAHLVSGAEPLPTKPWDRRY